MKFVILGALRSGTHLLATLLNSHSQLKCYDECFASNPELVLDLKRMEQINNNEGFILLFNHLLGRMTEKQKQLLLNEFEIIRIIRDDIDKHALSLYNLNHNDNIPTHSKNKVDINYDKNLNVLRQKRIIINRTNKVKNFLELNKKNFLTISYE